MKWRKVEIINTNILRDETQPSLIIIPGPSPSHSVNTGHLALIAGLDIMVTRPGSSLSFEEHIADNVSFLSIKIITDRHL